MRLPGPELWKVVLPDRDELGRRDIAAFEHHPVDFLPQLPKALQWANEPMPFDIQVQRPGRRSRHLQGRDVLRLVGSVAWLSVSERTGCVRHDGFPPAVLPGTAPSIHVHRDLEKSVVQAAFLNRFERCFLRGNFYREAFDALVVTDSPSPEPMQQLVVSEHALSPVGRRPMPRLSLPGGL